MNTERIRELADIIERQPHTKLADGSGFNMASFDHICGTPACICGWAAELWGEGAIGATSEEGAEILGVDNDLAGELFYAYGAAHLLRDIRPAHAAAVLRNLAETGVVDWSVGAPAAS